jgi:hypothetical protein
MNRQGILPFFFLGSIMIWKPNVTVAAVGASLIVCPVNIPMCDGNIKLNYVVIWTKPYKYPGF